MLYLTENPHGGDIYGGEIRLDFSANTNPYGTPQAVVDAMSARLTQVHHYPDPYCRELVEAIGAFEGVPKGWVLCGNGAAELIYSYCEAVRPRRAMELAPTFSEYSLALERVGCQVDRYPLQRQRDFALGEEFLPALEKSSPDVLFLCNPNNPTGQALSPWLLEKILEVCSRRGIRLFVDECFLDLSEAAVSLKGCLGEHRNLFLLKAFTKSYGMAGLRLGYGLCADSALLEAMSQKTPPWNVSTPAQAAGAAALGEQEFLQKTRRLIQNQRAFLARGLTGLGLRVFPSQANFLLFYSSEPLEERLDRARIQIRDCRREPGLGPGWYRVAVKRRAENQRLLAALADER